MNQLIAIIGAGVSGLTTGIELLRQGSQVTIYAEKITPNTTSDVAAAMWSPYKIEPQKQAMQWALHSLEKFKQLMIETPETGIAFRPHTDLHTHAHARSEWMKYLDELPTPTYIPEIYQTHSHTVNALVIDTTKYIPYLNKLFLTLGGTLKQQRIDNILEIAKHHDITINCSGIGAKSLVGDDSVYPIRGYVLSVKKIPNLNGSMVREDNQLTHIFTRNDDCLLGGTVDIGNWDLQPDTSIRDALIKRVKEICPMADNLEILAEKIGLRPGRPCLRLESERINDQHNIIHNYGHGGAGITVSWGCAAEVVRLVIKLGQNQ